MFGWRETTKSMPLHFGRFLPKDRRRLFPGINLGVFQGIVDGTVRPFSRVHVERKHVPTFRCSKDEESDALVRGIERSHVALNDSTTLPPLVRFARPSEMHLGGLALRFGVTDNSSSARISRSIPARSTRRSERILAVSIGSEKPIIKWRCGFDVQRLTKVRDDNERGNRSGERVGTMLRKLLPRRSR
jgi:hypothetical protein